jgi:hypothetical protein
LIEIAEYLPSEFNGMPDSANHDLWLVQCRLVSLTAAAVTTFYLHCLYIITMSTNSSQQWADHETEAVLLYFVARKAEIGDAGNFKKKTYAGAAESIQGHTRTWEQVKTKWQAVSYHLFLLNSG